VRPGDVVTELDGRSVAGLDVLTLMRRLEGPPGSRVSLTLLRDAARRTVVLVRRRLL
jgi:C-terminal processing protease CtpA/Prc